MADRGMFRVDARPPYQREAFSFLRGIRQVLPFGPKLKATDFGQAITSLDQASELRAFAMYSGEFCFGGETNVASTPALFSIQLGSKAWQESLFNLEWLADFSSSKRQLHAHYALRLLGRWTKSKRVRNNHYSMSHALIALCTHGFKLARIADASSQAAFLRIVSNSVARISALKSHNTEEAFLQSVSILYACTAFQGFEPLRKSACDTLNSTLNQLILPDGGPVSCKPQDLIDLMSFLLPLQAAMKLNRQIFPKLAADCLHKMFSILAMLPAVDGTLSERIVALLAFDLEAQPLTLAAQTGFARLVGGKTILFADTKSNFQFELAVAGQRFFKSHCESPTATTQAQLHEAAHGVALQVEANALRERIYFLSADGTDFRVEDGFDSAITLCFNLAPHVKITATREGGILLIAPDQTVWNLTLRGGKAQIGPTGTAFKVISSANGKMNWAFKKQAKIAKSTLRKKTPEPDLLA